MHIVKTKRLDHLGLIMSTIKEFKIIEFIDQKLVPDPQHKVTTGEAIVAMMLNGLGFVSKPLSLTPQFFQTKAVDLLFGRDIEADDLNRHRLGRALDAIHQYDCELLFTEIATHICQQINLNNTFTSLDTTSFAVSGNYDQSTDEHEIKLTYGYSKDGRPDLKQAVLELVTSQDGGIPLMMKCWDGNANDNKVFQERAKELIKSFQASEMPRYLVADAKLYHQNNQDNLANINFITRIPRNYTAEKDLVSLSMANQTWVELDEESKYCEHQLKHLNIDQRWFVIYSSSAHQRTLKTIEKAIDREYKTVDKAVKKLSKEVFNCEKDAIKALEKVNSKFTYHSLISNHISLIEGYQKAGRPKENSPMIKKGYQLHLAISCLLTAKEKACQAGSCYVIGTNARSEELSGQAVIAAYKNQNASIERGFRFLKDPQFFVASFFVKKPSRIKSLLMIMTLCLLIYSVMQRQMRQKLKEVGDSLPNQINKPIQNPTMRWIFQLMEGIDVIYIEIKQKIQTQIMGMNQLRNQIISLFYPSTVSFYSNN